jgi:hypothetical protein
VRDCLPACPGAGVEPIAGEELELAAAAHIRVRNSYIYRESISSCLNAPHTNAGYLQRQARKSDGGRRYRRLAAARCSEREEAEPARTRAVETGTGAISDPLELELEEGAAAGAGAVAGAEADAETAGAGVASAGTVITGAGSVAGGWGGVLGVEVPDSSSPSASLALELDFLRRRRFCDLVSALLISSAKLREETTSSISHTHRASSSTRQH